MWFDMSNHDINFVVVTSSEYFQTILSKKQWLLRDKLINFIFIAF